LFFYLKSALTVCSSKGQALQLTYGLDFLSIQAYRLWMEHPSREKVKLILIKSTFRAEGEQEAKKQKGKKGQREFLPFLPLFAFFAST
jgi:hypothetical protein